MSLIQRGEIISCEVGDDSLTAAKQLLARCPDAQIFGIRVRHRAVHRFGFRSPCVSV